MNSPKIIPFKSGQPYIVSCILTILWSHWILQKLLNLYDYIWNAWLSTIFPFTLRLPNHYYLLHAAEFDHQFLILAIWQAFENSVMGFFRIMRPLVRISVHRTGLCLVLYLSCCCRLNRKHIFYTWSAYLPVSNLLYIVSIFFTMW